MKKLWIGLSGSEMIDSGGMFPGYHRSYVNADYVHSVTANGALPVILPCIPEILETDGLDQWMQGIDGLILTGGHDLFPPLFGEECKQKLTEVWPDRDRQELALLQAAIRHQKPVLGICRGFQLINAHFGGTVLQDLSYSQTELLKHWQGHTPQLATHRVQIEPGTWFSDFLGSEVWTNSFHHQVVVEVGEEIHVCGRTSDGIIEAVEHRTEPIVGVQWHPEMMSATDTVMKDLFGAFIARCEEQKRGKQSGGMYETSK